MKKWVAILLFPVLMNSCSSVPVSGRQQLNLVSDQEVMSLSLQEYNDYIKTAAISTDKTNTTMVVRVGQNIANAVAVYLKANNMESLLSSYSWEFNLIKDSQVNAFCMPGGKIVVYEGILPYTKTETGLAVVLGHEVAHAVAKHANERMSQQVAAQYGGALLEGLLGKSSASTKALGQTVYGLGAQYGIMLPFNRKQELEADRLGLIFMSIAGYNPSESVPFWQRMSQNGNGGTPEFMSTHPSDESRVTEIQKYLPEANEYYNAAKGNKITPGTKTTTPTKKTSGSWKY